MALKAPNLDDRTFQDIVREARSKIPLYCPRWTDYNLSDPGVTLIELFAWMTDMLLYRLNRVPEKNYIKFMELIGLRLKPPLPAKVDITFRLSAAQPRPIIIPKGTEVATVRTETQEAITYTTGRDLVIKPPEPAFAFTSPDGKSFEDCLPLLKSAERPVAVFQAVPQENNALYLGYPENLAGLTLILNIDSSMEGIGVDPHNPPLAWEYWDGEHARWSPLALETDTTAGLNTLGQVVVRFPLGAALCAVNGQLASWLRCRATRPLPGQRAYSSSPRIKSITSENIGGTVPASHCLRVSTEILGRSDGMPGQQFTLHNSPVLAREQGETVEVETERENEFEPWQEVSDFTESQPDDRHFTLDSVTGEIQFGPVIRQPSGEERQFGRIPPAGRHIRFTSYRWGGGVIGNVGRDTITVLKSSIPYVAAVNNFEPARGGTDAETLEAAKLRAPQLLRARTRAVTADDFEYLALEASPLVARARCLTPGAAGDETKPPPGMVRVCLVPRISENERVIPFEELEVPASLKQEVQSYLDERRLLATQLEVSTPRYTAVAVTAHIKIKLGGDISQVAAAIARKLYLYINPVCGGADGQGWAFGRALTVSDVYAVIQSVPGADYIEEVSLVPVDVTTGKRGEPATRITLPPDGLFCSARHEISAAY